MRGATEHPESQRQFQPFQSTRPMRGATYSWPEWRALRLISIHAPHAGRDSSGQCAAGTAVQFQSTRPMRGATCAGWNGLLGLVISIHAPHAGRDGASREPAAISAISIHAPHAGRDLFLARVAGAPADFNPRAPCGARQQKYTKLLYTLLRQKAILRQFHAKRRLLKHFSTYKYRNTFLICSANRMGKICTLLLRTTRSLDLPEGMSACNQSARFCFRTFFPSSKTADYPAPDP